ncbi:hypothetical protein A3728_18445 [Sulfitobacter sp. HI0040]|nr:hypothetical protein A3721_15025 [Sulfitobacter sp. HI0023]KZY25589.1 hypothetical protein A3728_18445 [Sulfitobacter sp. HI0040]KZZ68861.1 hypothetical protein A3764_12185 [Sulfitobacter sp. HI0129]
MRVNWSSARAQEQAQTAHVCRGYLTMLRNECKRPRNPELAVLVEQVVPDRDAVFANRNEFMLHHNDPELATSFRNAFAERM